MSENMLLADQMDEAKILQVSLRLFMDPRKEQYRISFFTIVKKFFKSVHTRSNHHGHVANPQDEHLWRRHEIVQHIFEQISSSEEKRALDFIDFDSFGNGFFGNRIGIAPLREFRAL